MEKGNKVPAGFRNKISRAPFFKWEEPGQSFTGIFVRLEASSKYENAAIAKMVNENGERQAIGCPTMLRDLLDGMEPGTHVHIVFSGEEDTGEDSPMKTFDVFTK